MHKPIPTVTLLIVQTSEFYMNLFLRKILTKLHILYCRSCKLVVKRIVTFWLHPDFIYNRTKYGKLQKEYTEYMKSFTDEVIKKKRIQRLKNEESGGKFEYIEVDLIELKFTQ